MHAIMLRKIMVKKVSETLHQLETTTTEKEQLKGKRGVE